MKTAGIIAEYNPFHTGHEYQINYIKEKLRTDYVVTVSYTHLFKTAPAGM